MKKTAKTNQGFTIVELLFAMTVFSLILIGAAAGLMQIGRMYYRSVITTRTQDVNRTIIDEVSRAIQFSGSEPNFVRDAGDGKLLALCVGGSRYSPVINQQIGASGVTHGLYKDEAGAQCTHDPNPSGGTELLGDNMRLTAFDVQIIPNTDQYRVNTSIAYGEDDLLQGLAADGSAVDLDGAERVVCRSAPVGTEFCAISELATLVSRRVL